MVEGSNAIEATVTVDPGIPAASARCEFERRRATREDRIRARHPKLGGFILALSDDPQSTPPGTPVPWRRAARHAAERTRR